MAELFIGLFADGPPFTPETMRRRGLGGSETAAVQIAQALHDRGHRVVVYNNCPQPGDYDGVTYHHKKTFIRHALSAQFDVFIVSRFYGFFQVPINSRLKVLWNHDTLDKVSRLPEFLPRFDVMFNLSRFHLDNYARKIPAVAGKAVLTRNGVDLSLIDQALKGGVIKSDYVVYVSRPERGLEPLLREIWPRLRERRPGLSLKICGYNPDAVTPEVVEIYERLDRLIEQAPGVESLGSLSKIDYYRVLAGARALLYPCTFPEISCIVVLEAQAAWTPVVTTDDFALSESVGPRSYLIPGRPGDPAYVEAFVNRACELIEDDSLAAGLARRARAFIERHYTWPQIAAQWEEIFVSRLAENEHLAAGLDRR
ncbi:MAG: glycosyltransferase family 4 protein [Proteobacteria bacterium]|nr:glycosyltransferase family 4 protein [Pseudomonadota bacterium]